MALERVKRMEEILDPVDWESTPALGHRMLDEMLAAGMNSNLAGRQNQGIAVPSSTTAAVERTLI